MGKLVIKNTAGTVQFSTTFANMVLAAKGTITSYTAWTSSGITLRSFSVSYVATGSNQPLCATRNGAYYNVTQSGSTYTFTFLCPTSISTLDYYIFDEPPLVPSSFGLNIWSDTGKLIYSSDYKPLRIKQSIVGNCGFDTSATSTALNKASTEDFSYGDGRDYVPLILRPSFAKSYQYQGAGTWRLSTWAVSATSISSGISQTMIRHSADGTTTTSPNSSLQRFALGRSILAVDVTNF